MNRYQNKEQRQHSNKIYKLPFRAELCAVIVQLMSKCLFEQVGVVERN